LKNNANIEIITRILFWVLLFAITRNGFIQLKEAVLVVSAVLAVKANLYKL
jgi:hypothetical protein